MAILRSCLTFAFRKSLDGRNARDLEIEWEMTHGSAF